MPLAASSEAGAYLPHEIDSLRSQLLQTIVSAMTKAVASPLGFLPKVGLDSKARCHPRGESSPTQGPSGTSLHLQPRQASAADSLYRAKRGWIRLSPQVVIRSKE